MAFINAANIQPPKSHQTFVDLPGFTGANKRAIPAKSMLQNAVARIVAQRIPKALASPSMSMNALSVTSKLNTSKANNADEISRMNMSLFFTNFPLPNHSSLTSV